MRIFIVLAALGFLSLLVSCNSMSKEECAAADWKVVGDSDGASGFNPQERFAQHVKSCARIKIVPDQTVWFAGYQEGVKRYCTPLSGAVHGEAGDGYHNVCSPETEPGFMRGYSLGKRVYDARSRLQSLQSDISYKESEAERLYGEMRNAKDEDRRRLRDQADDLDREARRLRREADDAGYDLQEATRELDYFRQVPQQPYPVVRY